jgi:protein-disulfide isomerase
MKRFLTVSICLAVVFAFTACPSKTNKSGDTMPGDGAGVAAVVNGKTITIAQLDTAAKSQLQKVKGEIYKVRKRQLDELIEETLIEEAAKKQNMSVDAYLDKEVNSKVQDPTEQEIKALYEARKARIGRKFDEVKGQLAEYLQRTRMARARNELIMKLRKAADVKIDLQPPRVEIDLTGIPIMGDKDAEIVIVEFSDYQCPFCKRVRPTIWRLMEEYKGKIAYAFVDFPLSFHKEAQKAHEAGHCAADQDKYYEYNKILFEHQRGLKVKDLKKYASELKLNQKKFDKCLDSGKYKDKVAKSVQKGVNAGVSGTPAFFINGIMLSGAQPYESFVEVIEAETKR